jgi:hypothetical protein
MIPFNCSYRNKNDLAIDIAKENAWMALYEHDSDTLEDILYRCLQDLWAPLTNTMKVFDTHGSTQQLCARRYGKPFSLFSRLTTSTCRLFCSPAK